MAEVPRQSTFPPILQDYLPGLKSQAKPLKPAIQGGATVVDRLLQGREALKPAKTGKTIRTRVRVKDGEATAKLQSVSEKFKVEEERERRQKRGKRADATVRCWDGLLQQERDEKYSVLKQKVQMQRQLMSKRGELTEELRVKAKGEQIERMQSKRAAHKEMVQSLRAHVQRIEEHKKKIAENLQLLEMGSQESGLEGESSAPQTPDTGRPAMIDAGVRIPEIKEGGDGMSDGGSEGVSPRTGKSTQTALMQLLRIDPEAEKMPAIESMWGNLKADTTRKLRPAVVYSKQLKEIASPSVKHCLSVYEQPTMHDRYTGKPVPLTAFLNESTQTRAGGLQADRRVAMELSARRNQRRADIMLSKKEMAPAEDRQLEWYIGNQQLLHEPTFVKAIKSPHTEPKPQSGLAAVSTRMGKQRPKFLTKSDSLVTCSLEELGSEVYLKPSSSRTRDKQNNVQMESGSIFLTDLQLEDELSTASRLTDSRDRTPHGQQQCPGWQPLSSSALTEYSGVVELPVSGIGHVAHGKYKLWRPRQAVCNSIS